MKYFKWGIHERPLHGITIRGDPVLLTENVWSDSIFVARMSQLNQNALHLATTIHDDQRKYNSATTIASYWALE